MLVRSFFSVCVFDGSDTELEKADKRIREILNLNRFKYYIPGYGNWQGCTSPVSPDRSV